LTALLAAGSLKSWTYRNPSLPTRERSS